MAKLPNINYNTQVQTLGREDVSGPVRVANAETAAIQKWGQLALQVATVVETNQIAEASAKFSNEMAELNARVKNGKVYTSQELDEAGVEYQKTSGGVDRVAIPAHEVAVDYYKSRAKSIYDANVEGLSGRGKKVMEKTYASKYAQGIDDVVGQQLKYAHEYAQAQSEMGFEQAVNSSNIDGAVMIADTALANGTWSPTYYASKMGPLPGRITQRLYLDTLDAVDDPAELENLQGDILNDQSMTNAQVSSVYKDYESKIKRRSSAIEKEMKAAKEEQSSLLLTETAAELTLDEVDWTSPTDVLRATASMTPADRKSAVAIWRAERNGVSTSNADSLKQATLMVRSTIIGDELGETNFLQRRNVARQLLTDMLTNGDIVTKDYTSLLDDLNSIRAVPFKSPEYQMVEDDIYITLTGGTKSMVDLTGGGPTSVGLANAMWELNNAALEGGPGFDPRSWWATAKSDFLTRAIIQNTEKWESTTTSNITKFTERGYVYDDEDLVENLDAQVANGELTQEAANKIITDTENYVNEQRRLESQLYERGKITQ